MRRVINTRIHFVHGALSIAVADLGEAGPSLILGKKEEMTEGKMAGRHTNKQTNKLYSLLYIYIYIYIYILIGELLKS